MVEYTGNGRDYIPKVVPTWTILELRLKEVGLLGESQHIFLRNDLWLPGHINPLESLFSELW